MKFRTWILAIALFSFFHPLMRGQNATPFFTMPITSRVTFTELGKSGTQAQVAVQSKVSVGADVVRQDNIAGMPMALSPYSPLTAYSSLVQGSFLYLTYGRGGFVFFRDANGGGIGWHFLCAQALVLTKINKHYYLKIQLEAPFWLGDPPANVSESLLQMKNANRGTILLQLDASPNLNLSDFYGVGVRGRMAAQPSYTFNGNGYLYAFQ